MNELLDSSGVFENPFVRWGALAAAGALVAAPLLTVVLERLRLLGAATRKDVWTRYLTWLVLAPVLLGAVLWCPASAIAVVLAISLLCYREFARATGLFRQIGMSVVVVAGIVLCAWANLDNWYGLYVALPALVLTVLAAASVLRDEPRGYLQRVSLAAVAFLLFGTGLNYLGLIANYPGYRGVLLLLIAASQLSDIAAYCFGKALGRRKVFPNTSPNKTLGGHLGAMLVIAPLAALAGHYVFRGTAIDEPLRLAGLGLLVGAGAQLGDLVVGSIKRDIGIKDMGATLPGHGGFLDRFNSLLLVAPAAFHYLNYFGGFDIPILRRHLLQQLLGGMGVVGGGA